MIWSVSKAHETPMPTDQIMQELLPLEPAREALRFSGGGWGV